MCHRSLFFFGTNQKWYTWHSLFNRNSHIDRKVETITVLRSQPVAALPAPKGLPHTSKRQEKKVQLTYLRFPAHTVEPHPPPQVYSLTNICPHLPFNSNHSKSIIYSIKPHLFKVVISCAQIHCTPNNL